MGKERISIIGAGKVGTALSVALHKKGYTIGEVISRSPEHASGLAAITGAVHGSGYNISTGTHLVIISVPDHALADVASRIRVADNVLVVHTAGSFGTEVFPSDRNYGCGVLYPLQTFSPGRNIQLDDVPFLIEADSAGGLNLIRDVASSLSTTVSVSDREERRRIHLAAVFACNFVNFMLGAAEEISLEAGVDFKIFEPLVRETFTKAFELGPSSSQTGPAVRNDHNTIEKHLDLLSFSPELKEVYHTITRSIINKYTSLPR